MKQSYTKNGSINTGLVNCMLNFIYMYLLLFLLIQWCRQFAGYHLGLVYILNYVGPTFMWTQLACSAISQVSRQLLHLVWLDTKASVDLIVKVCSYFDISASTRNLTQNFTEKLKYNCVILLLNTLFAVRKFLSVTNK